MPKYSTDPKERTIKARINAEMSQWVDKQCRTKGVTVTEYIRDLIEKDKKHEV